MNRFSRQPSLRRLLLPLALLIAMLSLTGSAQALTQHKYVSALLPAKSWSGQTYAQSWIMGHVATYEGAGQINVCQKVFAIDTLETRSSCGLNGAGNALNTQDWAAAGYTMWPQVKNDSSKSHTINGYVYSP